MHKSFGLVLILILMATSLMVVELAFAQSIPKPSVPEFTVKFVDASYNVAPSSSINPYTGQNVTNEGYHVENRTIELIIKNQPFASYISNGQNISFYLNVREKGHYEENWTTIYNVDNYYTSESNTNYTTLTYSLDPNVPPWLNSNIPSGGQVDFQVEALIGSIHRDFSQLMAPLFFDGQESGWSNTQTITIKDNSTTVNPGASATPNPSVLPSQNPTATLSQPGAGSSVLFGWNSAEVVIAVLLGVVAVLLVFVVVYLRRRSVR